jgi:hypothetical protein
MHPGSVVRNRRGAGVVWVIVAVLAVFALFFLFRSWLSSPPGPVTYNVWTGALAGAPPTAVTGPTTVVYHVSLHTVTVPYGAGTGATALGSTRPVAQSGIAVTFTLDGIDARFDDMSSSKTVTTDAAGNATFIIIPRIDGSSGLAMSYVTGDGTNVVDTDHPTFEVDAP